MVLETPSKRVRNLQSRVKGAVSTETSRLEACRALSDIDTNSNIFRFGACSLSVSSIIDDQSEQVSSLLPGVYSTILLPAGLKVGSYIYLQRFSHRA